MMVKLPIKHMCLLTLALTLVACQTTTTSKLPTSNRLEDVKETRLSNVRNEMLTQNAEIGQPAFIRIFKEERTLETWIKDTNSEQYIPYKQYPICKFSGDLGPKLAEGDGQAPEGFYEIGPDQLNPWSNYHLSLNLGYPNEYDRARMRTGSNLMVHGGCWQKSIADRTLMNYAAEALRRDGLAVWNIEYRGVDETGGGYPGTYQDVARAADALRNYAEEFNLDLTRVAGFGHSAGGHLVTWLAGRKNLPENSVLSGGDPLPMLGVVNSGGLADLDASEPLTLKSCLADVKDALIGPATPERPDPLSDTSSDRLLPTGLTIYSVNGERDHIAPPALGDDFTAKAKAAGDTADNFVIPNEAHVELISPGSAAFKEEVKLLKAILNEEG